MVPATDVDHIVPFQDVDDPRRLDPTNLQSLCHECHSRKTQRDRKANRTRKQYRPRT
jgi:5-methylcytosine-specific restriction protein A